MNENFVIMCCNTAHPSGQLKYYLFEDDDENTVSFDSDQKAKEYIKDNAWTDGPVAYAVLNTSDLNFAF